MDPESSKWWERLVTGVTQVGADLPIMIPAGAIGVAGGTAAGGPVGGILGGGAAMFAAPAAIKTSLVEYYKTRDGITPADWFNSVRQVAQETLKEGAVGAVTMGAGALARGGAAAVLGGGGEVAKAVGLGAATMATRMGARATGAADVAAQIAAMVTMPAALHGQMPEKREFADAAAVILTLKGAHVALERTGLLRTTSDRIAAVYAKTGRTPVEQIADAQADPKVAEDMTRPADVSRETSGRMEMPTIQEALFRETQRLTALEEKAGGTVDRTITDDFGNVVTIPGRPKEFLTDAEKNELASLRERVQALEGMRGAGEPPLATEATFTPTQTSEAAKKAEARLAELESKAQLNDLERAERVFLTNADLQAIARHFKLTPEAPSRVEHDASAQRIQDDFYRQAMEADQARRDAGIQPFGEDHARAVALLVRRNAETLARSEGILPEDVFRERQPSLRDASQAVLAAEEAAIPAGAPTFTPPEVDLFGAPIEAPRVPRFAVENLETKEIPLKDLVLSKEVPQFKHAADEQGIITPLGGQFDRTGVGPIQVWERLDGTLEVISGRHRLDLARRSNEETIPAQVHREAEGFDARQAATLDAQLNIREEQGSVADYAQYFKDSGISKEAADERGLLARAKGRTGFAIARDGTPDLIAANRAGVLSDEAALSISLAAPGSERLQALGIAMVQEGKSILVAVNTMKAVDLMAAERMAKGAQGDIFGFDDSAMQEAAKMAKLASSKQRKIGEQIAAVSGASKRPELAKKMGVDVQDPQGIQKRIVELRQEQELWDNWPLHPELVAKLRAPEVTGREGDLKQGAVKDETPVELVIATLKSEFPNADFFIAQHAITGDWKLHDIEIPKDQRKQGIGTAFMERLTALADAAGARLVLTAAQRGDMGGATSRSRLVKFYKRFGFVENKGRNKDFRVSDGMIRDQRDPNILHQEPFELKPETPAELAARNAEAEAQAKRRLAEETETAKRGRELTPEERRAQFDLFNTQQTLFQSRRAAQFETPEFKQWFGESQVVDENGAPLTVFHGTARPDRIGTRFRKDRATSGPMAFFTDDPAIASNYAKGKPDTSLDGTESAFDNYFLYVPKGARAQRSIVQKWWEMTPEQRAKFNEVMPRLRENEETGKLEDGGAEGGMAGAGTYEMYLREGRGNGIKAAIDLWLSSGAMFDREEGFLNVMKMAGVDMKGVEYIPQGRSMDAVYPVHLAISNPLDTGAIPPEVVSALEAAAKKTRMSRALDSGDPWDKRRRFSPREWVDTLREDIASGKNSFVWTSIPDWVTRTLEGLGFDGIRDTGGKMGGAGHDVWVPFKETQVKSAIGNRGTFDPNDPNILRQEAEVHRASYNVAERLITTLQNADKTSVVHELGHHFLENLRYYAGRPQASERTKAMWGTAKREFAIGDEGEIPRASHETMAKSWERYLGDGEAPTPALKAVFEQFKAWMLEIYNDLKNIIGAKMNPEVKDLFDRMLATDQEIADARELNVPRAYVEVAKATEARKIVPGFKAEQVAIEPYADELPKGPGEAPANSHVNYAGVDGSTRIKLTLQRLAEIDQQNVQKARGGKEGVETWQEEQATMEKWLLNTLEGGEDRMRLYKGTDPNDPKTNHRLRAMKQMMVGAGHESERLRDTILERGHNATIEEQLQYLSSIELLRQLHAEFLGERAAVARAMNALKDTTEGSAAVNSMLEAIGRGQDPNTMFQSAAEKAMADQAMLKAKLDEILLRYNGKSVLDIARLHKEIGTLKGTFKLAETIEKATTWEMVVEGWKSSILSGPVTHATNFFGTGAFQALRPPVDALSAVIGMARGASPGMGESDRASMSEAVARVTGMLGGVQDGIKAGYHTFKLDDPTGKVEAYRTAIPGRAGELIRIPLRLMGAEDAIVSTMYKRGELATLAIRQAFDEGRDPGTREFADRVETLKQNPTPEMELAAEAAATRMTFNMPLGEKGVALQLFVNKWNLQWMVPFIRTPINITKEVARMSPFAPLVGEWRADIAKGGVARDRALAETALGTGIMALTMAYAFSGQITGSGGPDPGKNRGKAGVEQPMSILIVDTWYEYARIQPVGTLMGMAANMATVWDHMTDEEKDKVPKLLARAFSNAVTNQTFLQGITNVINAMSEPARFAPKFLQQLAGSAVPNIIGQPTAMADPVVREVNSAIEAVMARLPGFRQELLVKPDWLGEDVQTKERLGVIGPVRTLKVSEDKVRLEAARLDISMAAAPKKTHIGKGTGKLGDVELTPEERNKFQRVGGEMAHRILDNIVKAPGYDEISDLVKRQIFAKVLTASHRVAAVAAMPPEKRQAYLQSITERVAQELAPTE